MKSKVIFLSQFTIAAGALFAAAPLYAQGYARPAPPTGGTGPSAPQTTQQEPYQPDNPFFRKASPGPSATGAAAAGVKSLSVKDKNFLNSAVSSASWEMATGKAAQQKAQNSATKEFTARMIADHSKTSQELVDLGKKKGLGISTEGGKAQQITGGDYDKRYLNLVVQDCQEEASLFAKEAKSGDDADIRNWAAKTLPMIKEHLALAKDAMGKAQ
jgi:putative membrane protein